MSYRKLGHQERLPQAEEPLWEASQFSPRELPGLLPNRGLRGLTPTR